MKILNIRTINGPNVFHHRPVLIMKIDLEELTEKASSEGRGFIDRLLNILPGLKEHHCSPGHAGGFVERLHRGTYPAHIIEHIALELSTQSGIGVNYGKTIYDGAPGCYQIAVRFLSEPGMKFLLEKAVQIMDAAWFSKSVRLEEILSQAKDIISRHELGPSTRAIIEAAEKRNIPYQRLDDMSFIQLGYGKYRKLIKATTTSLTSDIAVDIAQDKSVTKSFLLQAGIRVPKGRVVATEKEAVSALKSLGGPVVVKPLDGNHGRGVYLDLKEEKEVIHAFHQACEHSCDIIVEEYLKGHDYRAIVVGGKLIAAAHRIPAHVIGDGKRSIRELVSNENHNPLRGEGHERPMTRIELDDETNYMLKREGRQLDDIPEQNEIIYLKGTANISTGGSACDVTDRVHPEIRVMCERAAKVVGLDVCGIDLNLEDITLPLAQQKGGVIEVNAGPGIRMHHYPSSGQARDVGGAIISHLFQEQLSGRIPLIAITGTNGKTTVTRLVSHIYQQMNLTVGMTCTDGIYLNQQLISAGDNTGPISARTVLSDPSVDVAVLETARGGIIRRGLGFDWCDVGVITNIQPDHIGQDGIESIKDILWVKSLVIERVKAGGTIIVNADSPELMEYLQESPHLQSEGRKICYFSRSGKIPGGITGPCYLLHQGSFFEWQEGHSSYLMDASEVPLTMNGTATFQIENVLAAIAVCRSMEVPFEIMLAGLKSFSSSHNPGRTNLHQIGRGYVLLDYGHNSDAFLSIGEMIRKWGATFLTAVIGVPGDRSDRLIGLCGTAAAHAFDKIIIREDDDLRERAPGEVAALLEQSIKGEKQNKDIQIVLDSREALISAIEQMRQGEIVVYFYEDLENIKNLLKEYKAIPVDRVSALMRNDRKWEMFL